MYFNRKNAEQKNWRMIKKGKHFLFGCSLVFAVGAALVAPSVKADTVEAKPDTSSTTEGVKPVVSEENPTYAAPAVEVAPATAEEKAEKPVETTQNSKEEAVVATEKAKEADSIQAPEVTVVYDPSALTDEEKAKVVAAVKAANPTATDVQVQADGSVVVTFADGSSANLSAAQTIKDGSLVAKPRTNRAARATAPRASEGAENLDYSNKEDVEGYVKISYEVDKANNVIHWTVLDNPGRKGNSASGYVYFTIPKGSVGEPTNWKVVQTDKNGKVVNSRDYWKDNDGSYLMGQKGRMNTYTGAEMTKRLTQLYKDTKNPAIKGNEAAVAAQTAERSQALYTMTADNNAIRNVMWTITYDTPILDNSKPLDYVAGMQGTGLVGGRTNIMTGFTDNYIDNASSKFQAVAVKEKYTAKVGGSFAADPATYVTNKAGTPEFPNNYRGATSFKWKDGQAPTATEAGTYTKTVVVTYPAHYKQAPQEVTITFEVEGETPKPVTPAKPVVNTDLTGKAGTKTSVEVTADPGTTVELFDKDNNKIGEATADNNGKATITPKVDIPAGNVTAKATKDGQTSVASDPVTATTPAAPVVAPTVEIPYSNKDAKEVYVYAGEENSFDIKFKDDSGKIASATVNAGGNQAFKPVEGEENTINTQYGFKANVISAETPATADAPAVITYRGTPAATDGLKPEDLEAATKGENPKGMVLGWRYATATDTDGAKIENKAVGSSNATDPGSFRVILKPQNQKYDIATPTEKVTVADPANVTEAELAKIKEKVQLEYSQNNDDANLADKKGTTADKTNKIQSVTKDADGNLVVTYTDGSIDKKPLSEFVNVAPTVELPYSNQAKKEIYVYTGENTDLTFKASDNTAVKDMYVRGPGGIGKDNTADYGFTTGKIENSAVTHGDGTVSGATATIKMTGVTTLTAPNHWTSFVVAKDNNDAESTTDFRALDQNPNATQTPGYVHFIVKSQTDKYDIATPAPADKVEVADPTKVTDAELDKIKEKLQLEYNKKNDDANIAKDTPVDKNGKIQSVTKDGNNLVVTYTDGSKDTKPLTEFVTKKPTTPTQPEITTDLTGKAGTKTPVEVTAEPGTKVELFDKDGNKIGEATAGADGKAKITPTVDIPEGNVTAKATKDGQTSEASAPKEATAATPTTPTQPEITTDLTGKAGTKTPVEVTAEPGTKVELFDKDGNKIGEATAGADGKAKITPTVDIPEGNVTAKATKDGQTSEASAPKEATAATPTTPTQPEITTDLTGKAGTKTPVEVTAEPGTKVELFDKDGNKIGEATAGADGKAKITPTVDIPAGNVTAKATKDGQTSDASAPKEATAATPTTPTQPEITTDLTGKAGTKTPVEVTAEPGTKVELFDKDGNKIGEATAGADGKAKITPTVDIPEGNVTAKATKDGQTSDASAPKEATAATPTTPTQPEITTDLTGKAGTKTPVEVTAEPGTKVELFDKDGNKIGEATAGADGKAKITPTVDIPAGNVTAKATKDGQTSDASAPKEATAATPTTPTQPEITTDLTGKAGTKTPVEVTAEPGSKVEMYDKDGNKIGEGTADENGKATITPTVDIPEGNVTVVATKDGQTPEASDPVPATAAKDPATPATPRKPVVDTDLTGKAGTKTPVEVTAEPGTKVELFDKDGNKIGEAATGANGKAIITPTVDIPAGNVTAKATKDGQTSEASAPKVATAATPTTPTQPEITTDLTGKAGTKTPVEVTAEPGSKVEMYDKDGNKIGEATADENGKAKITPTVDIPEGNVTVVATKDGQTPEASDPVPATTAKDPATPAKDAEGVKDPEVKTPVKDPANLTDAEKAKVAEEVKKANPTAKDVEVGKDGTTTVTFPDGSKAEIPAAKTVEKAKDAEGVKDPEVKTPVKDPANLTDAEKAKVAEEVKKANPTAKDVEVGKDGTTTVTFPDGSKAEIPAAKTVEKAKDAEEVKDPEAKTPVKDPANLTDAEKAKVAEEVKKANPTAKDVEVGKDGTTTVTFPDGTTAVIPADKTVKKSDDKVVKDPSVTPVTDPSNLTDAEKAKVAEEVKKANPTAKDVEVGKDGTTTVTFPDGTTAVIPADKTVKKSDDKAVKDPSVTPVTDPSNLTDAEKAKVAEEVKKANPTAKDVEVGKDGTTTVTFPDGTTAVIPADKTVKKSDDKAVKDPSVTPVTDPSNLTDAEKAKVAEEVKKANPTAKDVEVGKDGTTTVTFPDGTTAVIPADKTVKKSDDKAVKDPSVTPVTDPSNLTDAEKAKVAEEVKKANPTAKDVEVGKDGTTTVTFPDGTTAVIPADKTVKKSDDKVVKDPSVTPVTDPSNLTDAEKAKVAEEVKKANPTAKDVEVGKDGTTTVTFPDGTTAVIPADKTVKKSDDKAVKDPSVTPVTDPSNLTDAEKAKVAEEVKKANPTAKDVEVGKDGTTTVTFPDGTTAVIPADKTVKKSDDKAVKDPSVTPVTDPSNLTDAEKAKVAEEVKKANPTVTDVTVGNDGTATVTYPDGTTAVIPADKTVKESADKELKVPAVTPVTDPSNLTDAEKAKVVEEVKKANPTVTDVKVDKDGTTTVTYPDGTTAVIPADKTVKESADKELNDPAVTPVTDPSNLTDVEKSKVADEVKKANPTVTDVTIGNDGTTTVTYPDGTTAVIPADKTVKKSDDNSTKDPAVTPVVDPSNLTDAEKAKVTDEVKKANPTVTDVTVGNDGTATITYPDGTTAVIPADKTVKKSADKVIKDPVVTPVVNQSNLTEAEKVKVTDEVKKANPTVTDVAVGTDGTATVTYPDGTTAVIPSDKTVKELADKEIKDPSVTPVTDPSNLTDADKAKVADEVKKANPTAKDVEVGTDGTATVTYPDGTTAVIPADKTVKKSSDKEVKDPSVTPVTDPSNLTDAEKGKVAEEVKKSNPTVTDVKVEKDGTTTVTYPDGTTAVIPADKTVKKSSDKEVKDPSVTPVTDPSNLTDAEKGKVAEEVKKSNPTVTDVKVEKDGTTTVTYPDGTTAVIPADKTVKKSADKAVKDPSVTPVTDPSNLTDAEKGKVAEEVKKANPTVTDVKVDKDGTTTVTYPDGTTAVIPADKTVKKSADKDVKDPSVTPVTDPSNLTDAEKGKVAEEVKKSNPTVSKVEVGNDGTTTVTYPDGTTAVIPADKTVKKSADKAVKDPSVTPVTDPSNLTDAEKAKVADEVKKSNPTVSKVEVGNDGTTTVTYPDGTTAVIPSDKTVKKSSDKTVKDPSVTPVTDPSNLTDAEKGKVAEEVKKANPTVTDVKVEKDGTTTVTYPDGTTAVIPADKTVKKSADKVVTNPTVTPVVDPSNLTDAEKAKVADKVKKANPTASKVEVGNDGTATVTFPDGSVVVLTPAKTVKSADSNGVKNPSVTPVTDPSNLTDAEKAKVADEVKKANPTATDIKVNNDGSVVVTFADGSVAVIASEKAVKEATKESAANQSAKKAGAKELPNTGTEQSNASLGLALLAAATGGLLFAKKRKEEE